MEIKDFIKDALAQIVDGVQQAYSTLASKGAFVPTENVAGAEGYFKCQSRERRTNKAVYKRSIIFSRLVFIPISFLVVSKKGHRL